MEQTIRRWKPHIAISSSMIPSMAARSPTRAHNAPISKQAMPGHARSFCRGCVRSGNECSFVLPEQRESEFDLWDLTVFRYGGLYLDVATRLQNRTALPRRVMPMIMRGLNRVFTGMLVQNQDELVLATSGSHSQSKTSPLLDELISVPRLREARKRLLAPSARGGIALSVRLSRGDDPGPVGFDVYADAV